MQTTDTTLKGADNELRRKIYQIKLDEGDLLGAAGTLATLRMDGPPPKSTVVSSSDDDDIEIDSSVSQGSGSTPSSSSVPVVVRDPYYFSDVEKCDVYVTIAECYLEKDEAVDAEVFVIKAGGVVGGIDKEKDWVILLRYR